MISQSSPCSFSSWSLISLSLTWHVSKALHYSEELPDSVAGLAVVSMLAALQAAPLMCHVQEGAINRSPRFGSFVANMKMTDDTNQLKRVYQSFSGTGDLPQPTTEPPYTEQHCHLILFSIFFLAEMFLAPRYKLGTLDCWDLPHFGVKVCQGRAKVPSHPWKNRKGCCSCISLLPLLCVVCRISQCCRAFSASV